MLFPYRLSSPKNRQRWTFGGVYPAAYARTTGDRSRVSFECLVEGRAPRCESEVRFLQIVQRGDRDEAVERCYGVGAIESPPLSGRLEQWTDELREVLERTEAMSADQLLRLHGAWRDP